jgi:hypothetical protein
LLKLLATIASLTAFSVGRLSSVHGDQIDVTMFSMSICFINVLIRQKLRIN